MTSGKNIVRSIIHVIGVPEGDERTLGKKKFEEWLKIFFKLRGNVNLLFKNLNTSILSPEKIVPMHTIFKFLRRKKIGIIERSQK